MDLVGGMPNSTLDRNALFVVVDVFTKRVHLWPSRITLTAPQLARLFLEKYYPLHGLPEAVISDRDSRVTSEFWRTVTAHLGIKSQPTQCGYHQQADRAERSIKDVLRILRCAASARPQDWDVAVPLAEFAANSASSDSDGLCPFERDLGYIPNLGLASLPGPTRKMRNATARALAIELEDMTELIRDAREDAAREQKRRADDGKV